jgi:hypothetical protein
MSLVAIDWNPSTRHLRQFALLGSVFFVALAGWVCKQQGWNAYVWAFLVTSAGFLVVGLLLPECVRYLYLGLIAVTFPIGWVVSHLILGLIYYGLFTLVALIFRLIGRDALERRFAPAATTYWQPKRMPTDVRQYFHQF